MRLLEEKAQKLDQTSNDLDKKTNELKEKSNELDKKERELKAYKDTQFRKDFDKWKYGIKLIKAKAIKIYKYYLALLLLIPIASLSVINLIIRNSNDSILSQTGFVITGFAAIFCFFAFERFKNKALLKSRSWFKNKIKLYDERPKRD